MSERKYAFSEGEFYHVYNRGNSKQVIYNTDEDYSRFIRLLYLSNSSLQFKVEYLERSDFLFPHNTPRRQPGDAGSRRSFRPVSQVQ